MTNNLLDTPQKTPKKFFDKINKQLKKIKQNFFATFLSLFKKENNFEKMAKIDQKVLSSTTEKKMPSFKQLKYTHQVLNEKEKEKISFSFYVLILTFIILILNLFFTADLVAKDGGSYTEGVVGLPKFINPLYAPLNSIDQDFASLIYSGLVRIDNQQNIVPDLTENWFVSEDQKTYTFVLKEGVKWHDGKDLTINDILFTFESIQNPEFKSPLASNFDNVVIEKVDEKTLRFVLQEPYAPFLENLTVGILPQHIWQNVIPANALLADFNLRPIGSGPFQFKSFKKDKLGNIKSYSFVKNKNYYDKTAFLNSINFKFYPDYISAVQALKDHNVEGLSYLPKELQSNLSTRKDLNYNALQLPQYTALFFNQSKNVALKNINVRQALAYALNKEDLIKQALNTEGEVIDAPILPGFIGYNPNIAKYGFDTEKAKKLLDDAGYTLDEDKEFRTKGGNELVMKITTVNKGENSTAASIIQKMWQGVGVKTDIDLVDTNKIKTEVIKNRDFEILLFGEIVGIDPDPYPFWHSSQTGAAGLNLANFVNKEADKVIEEARKISDPQKRHDKYIHFQNILNKYLPAIFLYTPKYIYPTANSIKGIDTQNITVPADRFANITNWYIKTRRALKLF